MISIIIPTKDEGGVIGKVLEDIKEVMRDEEYDFELLVVDASEDETPQIAEEKGARVVKQTRGRKGTAMKIGAKEAKGDIMVFIDGDDTYPASVMPEMIPLLKKGEADMVTGSRLKGEVKNMRTSHVIGNKIFTFLANLLYGRTSDLCTGLRAFRKEDFLKLDLDREGFGIETEIHIEAMKNNFRVEEIPITYTSRRGDSKLSTLDAGLNILKILLGMD